VEGGPADRPNQLRLGPLPLQRSVLQGRHRRSSGPYTADSVAGRSSFLSIKRVNPKTGKAMWEYTDERAPLELRFDGNIIRLVFRKEVQVLRFMTF